jgi:hypothetical protein
LSGTTVGFGLIEPVLGLLDCLLRSRFIRFNRSYGSSAGSGCS